MIERAVVVQSSSVQHKDTDFPRRLSKRIAVRMGNLLKARKKNGTKRRRKEFLHEFMKIPSRRLSDPGFDPLKIPEPQNRVEDSRRKGVFGHLCAGKDAKNIGKLSVFTKMSFRFLSAAKEIKKSKNLPSNDGFFYFY
ncbi:MAG: hypothetical protein K2N29_02510, partial [Ruminiclostridium sp.]|nr:hypothetical protein [Ruminiclostridium sp.]